MSDRIWNTPNQQDPWEACAEWEKWFEEQLPQFDDVIECWEDEVPSWFKSQIYGVMCDLHDKLRAENDERNSENLMLTSRNQQLNSDNLKLTTVHKQQAEEIQRLNAQITDMCNEFDTDLDKANEEIQRLTEAGWDLWTNLADYGRLCKPDTEEFIPDQEFKDEVLNQWKQAISKEEGK